VIVTRRGRSAGASTVASTSPASRVRAALSSIVTISAAIAISSASRI
jgi:hypothetical protein